MTCTTSRSHNLKIVICTVCVDFGKRIVLIGSEADGKEYIKIWYGHLFKLSRNLG